MRKRLYELHGGCCFYCGRPITVRSLVKDHFVPRNMGGGDGIENRVAACRECDQAKAGRHPTDEEVARFEEVRSSKPLVAVKDGTLVRLARSSSAAVIGDYWPDGPSWVKRK